MWKQRHVRWPPLSYSSMGLVWTIGAVFRNSRAETTKCRPTQGKWYRRAAFFTRTEQYRPRYENEPFHKVQPWSELPTAFPFHKYGSGLRTIGNDDVWPIRLVALATRLNVLDRSGTVRIGRTCRTHEDEDRVWPGRPNKSLSRGRLNESLACSDECKRVAPSRSAEPIQQIFWHGYVFRR